MGFIWNTYIAMAQTFLRPDLRKRKNLINSKNYSTKKNEHKLNIHNPRLASEMSIRSKITLISQM